MHVSRKGKTEDREIPEVNQFATEMDAFADCILNDKEPKASGHEGLADVKIMRAIYESADTGRTVKLSWT